MPASRLASLPGEVAAAIAVLLDPPAKAALRRACKALKRVVDTTVTKIAIGSDLALPPPALSAIRFRDEGASDERLRGLAPSLASLPRLESLRAPSRCRVSVASLEALAAACPQLRELHLGDAGGGGLGAPQYLPHPAYAHPAASMAAAAINAQTTPPFRPTTSPQRRAQPTCCSPWPPSAS
jgi:hypothetical protein